MIKRLLALALVLVVAFLVFPLFAQMDERAEVGALAAAYLSDGPALLGAANLVTAVVVTYRGLDTLGEVTVLFAASAGISLVFGTLGRGTRSADAKNRDDSRSTGRQPPSELVETGAALLVPLIFLFGVFVFVHGHLTPGGGFQGGVVIASGVLFAFLAGTLHHAPHRLLGVLEIVSGAGYVAIGLLGVWLALGFLDPRFLPLGEIGRLFSGGAIPVIYVLVGVKVGAELSGVIDAMRQRSES